MSDLSEASSTEEQTSGTTSSSKKIVIPTVENSESDDENLPSFRRKLSSSEGSEAGEDMIEDLSSCSGTRPMHLLKRSRREAREFAQKGDLEMSVRERVRCLAYTRLVYGDGHWRLAKAYGKLAEAYLKRKGYSKQALLHASHARDQLLQGEADDYHSNRLSHSNDVLGVMELAYFVMGKANMVLGEHRKAEQAFKKAEISSQERLKFLESGQISEIYIKILESLGLVYQKLNKFDSAVEYYEKALKQAKRVYGKTDKQLIPLYQGLGKAYQNGDGDQRKGLEMFEKCHELATNNYTEGSVEFADVVLATTTASKDDGYGQKEGRLEKCLEIYNEHYGPDHKQTIKAQEELCRFYLADGDLDKAAAAITKMIPAKTMVYGDPSVSLADSYQILGTIRLSQGKIDKAVKHLSKSQSMFSCILGSNHKKTAEVMETLDMIKKTPGASKCQTASEKLKERPRFNGTVGRSSALGTSTMNAY